MTDADVVAETLAEPLPPEQAIPEIPAPPRIPTEDEHRNELKIGEYPGHINYAHDRGHFHGCHMEAFTAPEGETPSLSKAVVAFGEWSRTHPNRLVVEWRACGETIVAVYTKVLSNEEIEEMNMVNREAQRLIAERKAKTAEHDAKNREAYEASVKERKAKVEAAYKELNKLADLGRRCEKNHKKEKK